MNLNNTKIIKYKYLAEISLNEINKVYYYLMNII